MKTTPQAVTEVEDEPLPSTFAFVMTLGAAITIGWILMFLLLRARW